MDSPFECSRGHEFGDQHQDLAVLLVTSLSALPRLVETQDVGMLQRLQDLHLILEAELLGLVVAILLQRLGESN